MLGCPGYGYMPDYKLYSRRFEDLFKGKKLDFSRPPKMPNGSDILKLYTYHAGCTLENMEYLIRHGAYVDREYWQGHDELIDRDIVEFVLKTANAVEVTSNDAFRNL